LDTSCIRVLGKYPRVILFGNVAPKANLGASRPKRSCLGQARLFSAKSSFKAQPTPEARVSTKSVEGKEPSTCIKGMQELMKWLLNLETQSYHTHLTLTLSSIPLVVHDALVRCLVDRRGVGLKSGKPESGLSLNRLYPRLSLSESSPTPSKFETESESSQSKTESAFCMHHHNKKRYQIGSVARDTSFFVSLCDKSESMPNFESSSNILHELDLEIDRTLRRLRKDISTIVSNSSSFNFVSNSDNSVFATNDSDFFEYSISDVNSDFSFDVSKSQELEPMENND
ncbi:hypothetical protein CR513_37108, partial [Mucuna pruriens]